MPRKSSTALTVKAVEKLRPRKTEVLEKWDAAVPGFGVRAFGKTGIKTWVLMARVINPRKKKRVLKRLTLGRVGDMTLAEARLMAAEKKALASRGLDPMAAEKTRLAKARAARSANEKSLEETGWPDGGFGAVAEVYIRRHCRKLRRGGDDEADIRRRLLGQEKLPDGTWLRVRDVWGDKPVGEIRKADLNTITDSILDAGSARAATATWQRARAIFNWAIRRGDIEADVSPFANMEPPAKPAARDRVLTEKEIKTLWGVWNGMGEPWGPFLKMLLATGQRRSEVARMRLEDIKDGAWEIPGEWTKNGKPHVVPLSSLALEILEEINEDTSEWVFSTGRSENPISGYSKMKKRAGELSKEWRLHDLRRTAITLMTRNGVSRFDAGRVANHIDGGVTGRHYDRHDYLSEKRRALEILGRVISGIIDPEPSDKVVQLRESR